MAKKPKQPKTSIAGFDQLDAVHKPTKKPKRETPTAKVKKHKAPKRPR